MSKQRRTVTTKDGRVIELMTSQEYEEMKKIMAKVKDWEPMPGPWREMPGLDKRKKGEHFNPARETKPQEEPPKTMAIGIHAISQFYGDSKQLSLFSDDKIDEFTRNTGIILSNRPESYGVVLNQSQRRVLDGILKAFSDTGYMGDRLIDKREEFKERNIDITRGRALEALDKPYGNIAKIPVIKLTQADIIKLSGYSRRQGDKTDAIEAISFLATKQFCFYWKRLKKDDRGQPARDKNGDYIKEEVMEVGTLFRIKFVKDEGGALSYYEISPSSVILDQVNKNYGGNYFLLVPTNWRDEVKQLTGKRASNYTYEFLFWLRLQYEQIRRYNAKRQDKDKKEFKLSKTWEEIAEVLRMPETVYKRNRATAQKKIQDAYSVAIKLGYLVKVEQTAVNDILYLNEDFYPKPGDLK